MPENPTVLQFHELIQIAVARQHEAIQHLRWALESVSAMAWADLGNMRTHGPGEPTSSKTIDAYHTHLLSVTCLKAAIQNGTSIVEMMHPNLLPPPHLRVTKEPK